MKKSKHEPSHERATGHGSDTGASGISVVVPVFNAEGVLPELVARLGAVLRGHADTFELLLVNDGSPDESWTTIKGLTEKHDWVRGISLMRNYGQHNALLCGIRAARFDTIVTMDDDLQNPPEEIPKMLDELGRGFDVVYGTPVREHHGLLRNLASRITKIALQSTMGAETARKVSAFRAFRSAVSAAFTQYRGPFVSIDVLLTWGTTRFGSVRVNHEPRSAGSSNYTVRRLITHALNMVTGFSVVPLQLASLVGFAFTLMGVGVLTYVLIRYLLEGSVVAGFPFLASVISIFSGAQLFALGIIGEYLARMHFRMMDQPPFTVRERLP